MVMWVVKKAVLNGTWSWTVRAEASPEPWLEKLLDGRSGSSSVNVPVDSVCGCWLKLPCDLLRLMPEPFSDPPASRDFCIPLQRVLQERVLLKPIMHQVVEVHRQKTNSHNACFKLHSQAHTSFALSWLPGDIGYQRCKLHTRFWSEPLRGRKSPACSSCSRVLCCRVIVAIFTCFKLHAQSWSCNGVCHYSMPMVCFKAN